ncbi:hypothetical protein ABIE45_000366 [Methylobacterium sp. OAE515]|uniref:hypothetical protein n=1 Tax=Methylobacterium sp. OAE515 TaxID=2817895 RepID=UPI0017897515
MSDFPRADFDTGMYCLKAIDRCRLHRQTGLFPELPRFDAAIIAEDSGKNLGMATREVFWRKAEERRQRR